MHVSMLIFHLRVYWQPILLHESLRSSPPQGVRGLYRGYFTTISREIPFSFIQYPVWEYFKVREGWRVRRAAREGQTSFYY